MVLRSPKDVLKAFYVSGSLSMYVWPFVRLLFEPLQCLRWYGKRQAWLLSKEHKFEGRKQTVYWPLALPVPVNSERWFIVQRVFSTVLEWIINFFKTCSSEWYFWATRDFWINSFEFYWFFFLSFYTVFCLVKYVLKTYSNHEIKERKYFPLQNSRD